MTNILRDLGRSTLAKGVLISATLVLSWTLPHLLRVEAVGDYYFFVNTVAFLAIVSTVAIEDHALSVVSTTEASRLRDDQGAIIGVTLFTAGLLTPALVFAFIALAPVPLTDAGFILAVSVISLWTLTLGTQRVCGELLRARGEIRTALLLGIRSRFGSPVTSGLLVTALIALIIAGARAELWLVIAISLAVSVLGALASLYFSFSGQINLRCLRIGRAQAREVWQSSLPYLGAKVAAFLARYIDIWIAGFVLTRDELGVYAVVATIAASINLPLAMTNDIVPSIIGSHLVSNKKAQLENTLQALAGLALIGGLVGVGLFIVAGESLLGMVYGAQYVTGYESLVVLSLAHLTSPVVGSAGIVLVVDGRRKSLVKATWSGVIVFVGVGVLGAVYYGLVGLAVGALCSHLTIECLKAHYCRRESGVKTNARINKGVELLLRWANK